MSTLITIYGPCRTFTFAIGQFFIKKREEEVQECIGHGCHMKHTKRLLIICRAERKQGLSGQTVQYSRNGPMSSTNISLHVSTAMLLYLLTKLTLR